MKNIEKSFQKIIFIEMVFSVLYALLGLFIFLNSEITNKIVGVCMGTFFIISGIASIFSFIEKSKIKIFHYNIVFGIASVVVGIFSMLNPLSIVNFLNISIGIWLLIESINKFIYFLFLRKVNSKSANILLVSSLLLLILAILIIVNPFRSMVITKTVGIFIILYNILNLNDLVLLKRRGNKILQLSGK